jgi:hypothetical protein
MNDYRLTAQRNIARQGVDIYALTKSLGPEQNTLALVESLLGLPYFRNVEPGETIGPFTTLTEDMAQHLMDSLWSAGLRPTEGKASAGLGAAQDDRIKHLTRLVEQLLPSALRAPECDL